MAFTPSPPKLTVGDDEKIKGGLVGVLYAECAIGPQSVVFDSRPTFEQEPEE